MASARPTAYNPTAHEINQDKKPTSWINWQIFYSSSLNTHCSYRDITFPYLQWKVLKSLNYLCNTGKRVFKSIQVFLILGFLISGEKQNRRLSWVLLLYCNDCPNF